MGCLGYNSRMEDLKPSHVGSGDGWWTARAGPKGEVGSTKWPWTMTVETFIPRTSHRRPPADAQGATVIHPEAPAKAVPPYSNSHAPRSYVTSYQDVRPAGGRHPCGRYEILALSARADVRGI